MGRRGGRLRDGHRRYFGKGLRKALAELDRVRYLRIMAAFFPDQVLNAIKDAWQNPG
jgi:hypothetical protein